MSKEEKSLKMLERRLLITRNHKSLNDLLNIVSTDIVLESSYSIFKINGRLIFRLYNPGMTRIRILADAFKTANLYGYLDNVSKNSDYADFVIYFIHW